MKKILLALILAASQSWAADPRGNQYVAMTATPGTAYTLTGATQSSWVATTPNVIITNNHATKKLYPDSVQITIGAIGTAGVSLQAAVLIDKGARYSSGGQALTIYHVDTSTSPTSSATSVFAGTITATAATANVRYVCRSSLDTANPVAAINYRITFDGLAGITPVSGGGLRAIVCPTVTLGPGDTMLIYLWLPSQTAAPTGEVTLEWWERQ